MRRSSRSPEDRKKNKEENKDKHPEKHGQTREAPRARELYQNIINIPEKKNQEWTKSPP